MVLGGHRSKGILKLAIEEAPQFPRGEIFHDLAIGIFACPPVLRPPMLYGEKRGPYSRSASALSPRSHSPNDRRVSRFKVPSFQQWRKGRENAGLLARIVNL